MRRNNAMLVLILILVLIIVAASIFIMRGTPSGKDDPAEKPPVTPAPPRETTAPVPGASETPSGPEPNVSPAPGETAAPTPTPEPTPAPTPEPTPAPTPTPPPADAEGSFRSDTGTGLNLRVDWRTYTAADGSRKLQADVSVVSYSIFASAQYKSITLRVGEKSWSADFAGVQYDGKDQISTRAASFTVDAPAPGATATVEWAYGGTYSGKDLKVITAKGTIQ